MRRYIQNFILSITLLAFSGSLLAQTKGQETIKWYTIEEVEVLSKKEKRKVFIDVYTNWCGWCKNMEKNTFAQQYIVRYINENYYPVKLNAEQKTDIQFRGHTYKFVKQSQVGFNELAAELLKGQMSYPTIVFLDEDLNLIQALQGYRAPDQFEMIMSYFGENNHKKIPWSKYEKTYQPMKR
jgi:thioredoxin-related protein